MKLLFALHPPSTTKTGKNKLTHEIISKSKSDAMLSEKYLIEDRIDDSIEFSIYCDGVRCAIYLKLNTEHYLFIIKISPEIIILVPRMNDKEMHSEASCTKQID